MIDVNNIFEPNYSFSGFRSNGYRQISSSVGIKTAGNNWNGAFKTLAALRSSEDWTCAEKEYRFQKKAAEAELAPKVYSLTTAYDSVGMLTPCIKMQHVKATTLYAAYCQYDLIDRETAKDIIVDVQMRLLELGVVHNDAHGENILLQFDREKNYITKEMIIDFEFANRIDLTVDFDLKKCINYFEDEAEALLDDYDRCEKWDMWNGVGVGH